MYFLGIDTRSETPHPDVWIIVPAFGEAAVIGDVIAGIRSVFASVVCVDDGSTDDTAAIARRAGAHVVRHPVNLGQGAAIQTGVEFARRQPGARLFATFDADGQHRVVDAQAMAERIKSGEAEIVLGSRFLDKRTKLSPAKRLVLRTAAVQSRLATGMDLTDAHNGLRALSPKVARGIHLTQNRMAHASELVHQIAEMKPKWVEQPVEIIYTDYSKGKGQSLLNSVNILADLLFR